MLRVILSYEVAPSLRLLNMLLFAHPVLIYMTCKPSWTFIILATREKALHR